MCDATMTTPMTPERLSRIDTMRSTRGMPDDIRKAFSELIREVERQRLKIIYCLEDHLMTSMAPTHIDGETWWDSMSRFSYIGDELLESGYWEKHPTAGVGGRQFYRRKASKP